MLSGARTVISDEIYALAGNKRGAHLSLSLERLDYLTTGSPLRIGLSATQEPIDEIARFLVGMDNLEPYGAGVAQSLMKAMLVIEISASNCLRLRWRRCFLEIPRLRTTIESRS